MENYLLQGALILVAFAVWEFVKLAVGRFFKKTVDTDYITATQCAGCQKDDANETKSVRDELSSMREILMVIGLKVGLDEKEMLKLVKK